MSVTSASETLPHPPSLSSIAIGVDYGTESGRVLALDLATGTEVARSVIAYGHGVMDRELDGVTLPPDWALTHPQDYLDVLHQGIAQVLAKGKIRAEQVVAVGIDVTACTVLPVDASGSPLCFSPQWKKRPHAWPKLWKHHAAQAIADRMTEVAQTRGESFLARYGRRLSSEWYFPKLIQIFEEDPEVYHAMARFIEVTDWLVWYLTGHERRSSGVAGYKALWSETEGLPSPDYFTAVNAAFDSPWAKLGTQFYSLGTPAGTIRPALAPDLGLSPETSVAVGNVDSMVAAPAVGLDGPGALVMVMGTSICHLTVTEHEVRLPGITGVVKDGVLPSWYGYEAGQAAVGDMFAWFVQQAVPSAYQDAARAANLSLYEYLESLAQDLSPGESGLMALDWWNGNRSILGDADLEGALIGLSLATRPEEIYRTLLESVAMGTQIIVDNFSEHGVPITRLLACGGLPLKSPLLMQIYADVTGLPVLVSDSEEIPARGSAIFGAVAAGHDRGGFASLGEASRMLAAPIRTRYAPNPQAHAVYQEIYAIYRELYQQLGTTSSEWMHRLKAVRLQAHRPRHRREESL